MRAPRCTPNEDFERARGMVEGLFMQYQDCRPAKAKTPQPPSTPPPMHLLGGAASSSANPVADAQAWQHMAWQQQAWQQQQQWAAWQGWQQQWAAQQVSDLNYQKNTPSYFFRLEKKQKNFIRDVAHPALGFIAQHLWGCSPSRVGL